MYVCMYVCMHACMHACMYVCMYVYMLRWPDSRESIRRFARIRHSRESFQGSGTEPFFRESRFGGLKLANRRFEAIRANRSHVMKISGRAKGAAKGSCGETVVQKGVFGESVSALTP